MTSCSLEYEVHRLREEHNALRREVDEARRKREFAGNVAMLIFVAVIWTINIILMVTNEIDEHRRASASPSPETHQTLANEARQQPADDKDEK
jgi:FtsZ-binding cell division protein ZapB